MVEIKSIERNSIESIDTPNLNNKQFRLNKITEIEEYFVAEIKERELMSKNSLKIFFFFYYFDKSLIVLSVTSTYRNNKCKFWSCIFIVYRTSKKVIKSNKK